MRLGSLSFYLFILLCACAGCKSSNQLELNPMRDALHQASFIYDIECIPLDKMERADTLWGSAIPSVMNGTPFLAYVVTGDCSYCISSAIQFIHAYFEEESERKLGLLVIKGNAEIFKYYIEKEKFNDEQLRELEATRIFNIDEYSLAQDVIYLIYNKRVINYVPHKN